MSKIIKKEPRFTLNLDLAAAPWRKVRGLEARLKGAAELALASLPEALLPAARGAELTVLLTTDRSVQTLNHDYRGKNKPTNVLSFPQFERRELVKLGKGGADGLYVGDIAIAYAFTAKEAKAEGKLLLDHVTHLMIHGILHLFGYDHLTPGQAARMEKLERVLMASLGLPDPYAPLLTGPRKQKR